MEFALEGQSQKHHWRACGVEKASGTMNLFVTALFSSQATQLQR